MATVDHSQITGRATVPDWLRQGETRLRLQTIVRLRWLAVLGQSVTVVGAYWVLGIGLPIGGCLAIIALSAWLNVALRIRYPASQRLKSGYAFVMLAYDILQLAALLDEDSTFYGDLFAHVVQCQGVLYLEDGLHRAVRAALQGRRVLHARVLTL